MHYPIRVWFCYATAALALLAAGACHRSAEAAKRYPVKGQVVGLPGPRFDGRLEVSLKHEDIPGFMPAMTMAYSVKNPKVLDGLATGDLVTATLIVDRGDIYLDAITKTGHADVPPDARPVKAMNVMEIGDTVPDAPMTDQDGRTRRLSDWRGQALAVTFVYTRCPMPDFCPLMDRHFIDLQRAIAHDPALRGRAHLVSISFDPAHDTPTVIAAHAKARGADPRTWTYLTGTQAAVDEIAPRFGVSVINEKDVAQTITHNLRTAIVDPAGRLVKVYSGNEWTVDAILTDLRHADAK